MQNRYWFVTIGWSSAAAYNTLWAAKLEHDIIPSNITVFRLIPTEDRERIIAKLDGAYSDFMGWLDRFENEVGVSIEKETIKYAEENYDEYRDGFLQEIKDVPANCEIVIDVTPGRKFVSALGLTYGWYQKAEHVFYLHLLDNQYLNRPLPEIPVMEYELRDFARGAQ